MILGEGAGSAELWQVVEGMAMPPPTTAYCRCGGSKLGEAGARAVVVRVVRVYGGGGGGGAA